MSIETTTPKFVPQDQVIVNGLVGQAELNGCTGTIKSFSVKLSRYLVTMENGVKAALKENNLTKKVILPTLRFNVGDR